jgi:formyltetrahydrofolate-dependent phosphoribosylglycinamide formyltransferase
VKRIAVLASGGGSNLQSIIDHFASLGARAAGTVAVVVSDRPQSGALVRAKAAGIETVVVANREADDPRILEYLMEREIDYVALAGYLKLIPPRAVDWFADRMLNVHPSLLPSHGGPGKYGIRVHQSVLNARETVSGVTVHLVTHAYDEGPVLAQWPVAVLPDDDAHSLAARVLAAEHALYPRVLNAYVGGERKRFPLRPDAAYMANPPITPDAITRDIIAAFS